MKAIKRDVAGHFIDAENCNFFLHTDIVNDNETNPYENARYCISLIGEWREPGNWGNLNISGLTYELCVFDKQSENPWEVIESYRIATKEEAIVKHKELVKKYLRMKDNAE